MSAERKIKMLSLLGLLGIVATVAVIFFLKDQLFTTGSTTIETKVKKEVAKGGDNPIEVITIDKDPEVEKRRDIRNRFSKYISVQTDGYNASAFGGITGLKVKVRNNTAYVLNTAEVLVSYLKPNGDVFKTETVYASNVGANASTVIKAPDSGRGTKVNVTLIAVTSRSLGLCFVAGEKGPDLEDPYACY